MSTQAQSKKLLFNSKELNKFLPSCLLNEIDGEQIKLNYLSNNKEENLIPKKEPKNVRKGIFIIIYYFLFVG